MKHQIHLVQKMRQISTSERLLQLYSQEWARRFWIQFQNMRRQISKEEIIIVKRWITNPFFCISKSSSISLTISMKNNWDRNSSKKTWDASHLFRVTISLIIRSFQKYIKSWKNASYWRRNLCFLTFEEKNISIL